MRIWNSLFVALALVSRLEASPLFGAGDDDCTRATPVSVGTYSGLQSSGAWYFPITIEHDTDWYRFTVQPGQRVDVDSLVTQATGHVTAGYHTAMFLHEYDATNCTGSPLPSGLVTHVSAINLTPAPKDYVLRFYAGVQTSGDSVVVTYDLMLQATVVQTAVSYCPGAINSLGLSGTLSTLGSNSVSANDLVFQATNLKPNVFALLASGTATAQIPFGDGTRCIGGALRRLYRLPASSSGTWAAALDIPHLPPAALVTAGSLRYFQLYYRDIGGPLGTGFNLTNGECISFTP